LPKGLVSSYSYLYHCVKGLGCEDAEAIEKYLVLLSSHFHAHFLFLPSGMCCELSERSKMDQRCSGIPLTTVRLPPPSLLTCVSGKAGLARSMHRVLTAISIIDSMGYCQGMNYIVDFLLKVLSPAISFLTTPHSTLTPAVSDEVRRGSFLLISICSPK
jgi:hypothetical protein